MTDVIKVDVARGHDEVAALRPLWESFPPESITTDFDYFHTVIESEPSMIEPWALAARHGSTTVALALARLEDLTLPLKFGYRTLVAPRLRSLTVVYRGTLGAVDDAVAEAFVHRLCSVLREGGVDAVTFRRLDVESPLFRAATSIPGALARQRHTRPAICWERSLPASFDEFLQSLSKSTRTGVKRYSSKLERDFAGRLEVRRLARPEDLDAYFAEAEAVAAKTYQRGLGVGVKDDPAQRQRARLALERGWLRSFVLELDGEPVAFCGGEGYGDRFLYGIPGYDPAFADYRVGTYVLMRLIEDLCADPDIAVLDFGFGDAEYKRRFGDRSWQEAGVHVFAQRARPVAINLANTAVVSTNDLLTRAARSLGVLDRVKRRWRSSVSGGDEAG
jgi:hypothetical protein